jgi:hypothetical protein
VTRNESRFIKRLILFLIVAALCPLLAFAYRFALNVAPQSVPGPEPIFTLVPAIGDVGFATPAPTSVVVVVPNGWSEYQDTDNGFAISVPTTWQRLPVKPAELTAALATVRQTDPELADTLGANGQNFMQNGVKFWAFDLSAETQQAGFATNVTVTRQTLPNAVSFDSFVAINLNQLNALTTRNSDIINDRVSIAGLPAERVRYLLALNQEAGAPITAAMTQYLVLNGAHAYVLTYATRTDSIQTYQLLFDQSAASLRFIGQ